MFRRVEFWLNVFNDKPIKSIKASHVESILDKYANGSVNGYGSDKERA